MVPWNGARTKVQIKLSIQRLRTLQEKKLALAKKSRREIADLLLKGRVETARLRVEGLIQDDIYVELLELLELYSEKLQARFNLLDASSGSEPEPSISDAVCAIVYAAPRTELKELQVLREILMHKFGREFSLSLTNTTNPPSTVPPRIISKLTLYTPEKVLVDAYLQEIARGYGVNWVPELPPPEFSDSLPPSDDATGGPGEGQEKEPIPTVTTDEGGKLVTPIPNEPIKSSGTSPIPRPPTPPPQDKTKTTPKDAHTTLPNVPTYPDAEEKDAWAAPTKKLTEEEELAKRFERLKNLR